MLSGYKTYIVGILIGVVWACFGLGLISKETAETLTALLMGGGLITLRAGMK